MLPGPRATGAGAGAGAALAGAGAGAGLGADLAGSGAGSGPGLAGSTAAGLTAAAGEGVTGEATGEGAGSGLPGKADRIAVDSTLIATEETTNAPAPMPIKARRFIGKGSQILHSQPVRRSLLDTTGSCRRPKPSSSPAPHGHWGSKQSPHHGWKARDVGSRCWNTHGCRCAPSGLWLGRERSPQWPERQGRLRESVSLKRKNKVSGACAPWSDCTTAS